MRSHRVLCLLVPLAVWLSGCAERPAAATARAAEPPAVAVAKVTRGDLTRDLELSAEFLPYQEVELHAKVAGYVKQINVDVGDRVRQGQLIASLEVPEMRPELAQASASEKRSTLDVVRARSDVQRAESALQIRKLSYDRLASVAKSRPNLIAQQEIDDAQARYQEAEAQLAAAKAALAGTEEQVRVAGAGRERVGTMLDYLRITAPFSGVITKRYANQGTLIQAGTSSNTQALPVVRLSQIDRLRLVLPVPESVVPRIHLGAPVEVRVDTLSRVFQGKVARFANRLEGSTRTMETEVDLPNPTGVLMPGMFAVATLALEQREGAIFVPVQALATPSTTGEGRQTVWVVQGQTAQPRPVRLGLETPERVEVLTGLNEGELVVTGNRGILRPGLTVTPKLVAMGKEGGR